MEFNVAIVGATGNVGQEMLAILDERLFPVKEAFALASRQSQVYGSSDGGDSWSTIVHDLPAVYSVEVQSVP
jgi:aspartate-semialdehyde dehydrogenase